MRILVIGSGGREHALVWKISQSPRIPKIYCAPGSAGIRELAESVAIGPEQIAQLADFAAKEKIDLTIVGPELPLTLGIADLFESRGLRIFGPNKAAAQLEGSKTFAKNLLRAGHARRLRQVVVFHRNDENAARGGRLSDGEHARNHANHCRAAQKVSVA